MFSFMDKQSSSAVFSCLLLEGIFLHRLIAAAFKGEPKMLYYYLGAAGKTHISLLLSACVLTTKKNTRHCLWNI